jgi:glycosyltransferase involved in cell wall biosynthesis
MPLIYAYYGTPWAMESGDDVRIHTICKLLSQMDSATTACNLSQHVDTPSVVRADGATYVALPRKFYRTVLKLARWKRSEDLNPLIKLTHYIDELIVAAKLAHHVKCAETLYVFGSMTLFSLFARLHGAKSMIVYDPLSNYAQTLYLRSRRNALELAKYGLYLALHKLQLKASNHVVYPSIVDLENATRMFKLRNATVIPNPYPLCYESREEHGSLKARRTDFEKPRFVLLAGGRGRINEEAVRLTIKAFNDIPPGEFEVIITGPWLDMAKLTKNPNIKLLGTLPHEKLKELLATADYGLAPVFSHAAGTFLKTLAYKAAGLDIVASPQALAGINLKLIKSKIYLVRNEKEFEETVKRLVNEWKGEQRNREVLTCDEALAELKRSLEGTLKVVAR